ncbi:MAG TPA: glycosyl hydrolase family 8, partial [Fibrobacteraceae bacterium]|nr:glycosyl hydrolase family 8 [Fibrobacteraceae bacterium]
ESATTEVSSASSVTSGYYGLLPSGANTSVADAMYSTWKASYVRDSVYGSVTLSRVMWDSDSGYTVSEGIGYGMLIAYFQEDWTTFNQFWNYAKNARGYSSSDLTPWTMIGFDNVKDASSATDADIDIATALVLAYKKTGSEAYLTDAKILINGIWNTEVNSSNYLLRPGDNNSYWDDEDYGPSYNPSYFSPVGIRLFAEVDTDHDWATVLDANYAWLDLVKGAGNGFFKDWAGYDGTARRPPTKVSTYLYHNLEAIRIPWRLIWDYYWNNDSRAYSMMNLLSTHSIEKSGSNPDSLGCRIINSATDTWGHATGSSEIYGHFLGSFCVSAMASGNQDFLSSCNTRLNAESFPYESGTDSYFRDILVMMFTQILNGKYVRP